MGTSPRSQNLSCRHQESTYTNSSAYPLERRVPFLNQKCFFLEKLFFFAFPALNSTAMNKKLKYSKSQRLKNKVRELFYNCSYPYLILVILYGIIGLGFAKRFCVRVIYV